MVDTRVCTISSKVDLYIRATFHAPSPGAVLKPSPHLESRTCRASQNQHQLRFFAGFAGSGRVSLKAPPGTTGGRAGAGAFVDGEDDGGAPAALAVDGAAAVEGTPPLGADSLAAAAPPAAEVPAGGGPPEGAEAGKLGAVTPSIDGAARALLGADEEEEAATVPTVVGAWALALVEACPPAAAGAAA